jgi:hypothetical protein
MFFRDGSLDGSSVDVGARQDGELRVVSVSPSQELLCEVAVPELLDGYLGVLLVEVKAWQDVHDGQQLATILRGSLLQPPHLLLGTSIPVDAYFVPLTEVNGVQSHNRELVVNVESVVASL